MNVCPECREEYPLNPFQSRELYERDGEMLCSSRCVSMYDYRAKRMAA